MSVSPNAWRLAGAAAAHQLATLADQAAVADDGQPTVIPLLFSLKGGQLQFTRVMGVGDVGPMIRRAVAKDEPDCWAAALDGRIVVAGSKQDALVVIAGEGDATSQIAIPYTLPLTLQAPVTTASADAWRAFVDGLRDNPGVWAEIGEAVAPLLEGPRADEAVELDRSLAFRIPGRVADGRAVADRIGPHRCEGASLEGPWDPRTQRFVLRPGRSIRPVVAQADEQGVTVRLLTGSSADDAVLAVDLAAAIADVTGNAVTTKDGSLAAEELRARHDAAWADAHERETYTRLLDMVRAGSELSLDALRIGPRLVRAVSSEADPALALRDRLRRARWIDEDEDVFNARILVVSRDGGELRVGTWAEGVPTVLTTDCDVVRMEVGADSLTVPTDKLAEALGDEATWLTETVFVTPGSSAGPSRAALAEKLRPHATDLRKPAAPSGALLAHWTLSAVKAMPEEVRVALQLGPIVAALLVAAADGSIDRAEGAAFMGWIEKRTSGPTATLFPGGAAEAAEILKAMLAEGTPPTRLFGAALSALRQWVEPTARRIYADEVRELALHIAQASSGGGWFSFLRPRVSAEEQQALDVLDALLAEITKE